MYWWKQIRQEAELPVCSRLQLLLVTHRHTETQWYTQWHTHRDTHWHTDTLRDTGIHTVTHTQTHWETHKADNTTLIHWKDIVSRWEKQELYYVLCAATALGGRPKESDRQCHTDQTLHYITAQQSSRFGNKCQAGILLVVLFATPTIIRHTQSRERERGRAWKDNTELRKSGNIPRTCYFLSWQSMYVPFVLKVWNIRQWFTTQWSGLCLSVDIPESSLAGNNYPAFTPRVTAQCTV